LWYIAQLLPAPRTYTQRIRAAISWYIWKGAVFKVPIMTLQRPKGMRGWEITHIEAKCRALLLCRMYIQSQKEGTTSAEWLRKWQLIDEQETPPQRRKSLEKLEYIQVYAIDMAYIRHGNTQETAVKLRQHMYRTLHKMAQERSGTKEMRIETLYPNTQWSRV
jgi:hypothetical protein